MEDSLISKLSSFTDSIERAKDKQTRQDIDNLAKDRNQAPPVRLRAFLSVGKNPPPELVTEANITSALNLDDQVNFLPKLASSMKLVKADAALRAILDGMKDIGSRRAIRITRSLHRATAKWSKHFQAEPVTDNSVQLMLQILLELSRYQTIDVGKRKRELAKKTHPYLQMVSIVTKWTLVSSDPTSILMLLRVMSSTEKRLAVPIEELIADGEFRDSYLDVISRAVDHCDSLIKQGSVSAFNAWTEVFSSLSAAKEKFDQKMSELYSEKARLPEPSQFVLQTLRGQAIETLGHPKLELDEEESLRTVQLASALVAAWGGKEDGSRAKDAYEELKSVAANFFNLKLHENTSQIEDFNPRIHELILGASPSDRVRLLGPWVEFSRRDISKVILKAPVKPA